MPKEALHRPQNELCPTALKEHFFFKTLLVAYSINCFYASWWVVSCVDLDSVTPGYAHYGPTVSDNESTLSARSQKQRACPIKHETMNCRIFSRLIGVSFRLITMWHVGFFLETRSRLKGARLRECGQVQNFRLAVTAIAKVHVLSLWSL